MTIYLRVGGSYCCRRQRERRLPTAATMAGVLRAFTLPTVSRKKQLLFEKEIQRRPSSESSSRGPTHHSVLSARTIAPLLYTSYTKKKKKKKNTHKKEQRRRRGEKSTHTHTNTREVHRGTRGSAPLVPSSCSALSQPPLAAPIRAAIYSGVGRGRSREAAFVV